MRSFVRLCNAMPFCGKFVTRSMAYALWSSVPGAARASAYRLLAYLLFLLINLHALQAWSGVEAACSFAFSLPVRMFGAAYAIGNALAITAQVDLLIRARRFRFRGPARKVSRFVGARPIDRTDLFVSVAVTLAAGLMAVVYLP